MATARHWKAAALYMTAPLVGAAFVYGGYWIPDVELRVMLAVPAILSLVTLVWLREKQIESPLPWPRLKAGAIVAGIWLVLASTPYGVRSALLRYEAACLPAWNSEMPFWRFHVVADNYFDYAGLQIAREPREKVEAFYCDRMTAAGWHVEERFVHPRSDFVGLSFAKGRRKIVLKLDRIRNDHATAIELYRVSFLPGAVEPGSSRRAWYQWVSNLF